MSETTQIQITVNGEPQQLAASTTVSAFINQLDLTAGRLAIEYNRDILPRAQWPETILRDGDKLEIVHFVGGG
jgi:thiamine biosynthesis protein ThiS